MSVRIGLGALSLCWAPRERSAPTRGLKGFGFEQVSACVLVLCGCWCMRCPACILMQAGHVSGPLISACMEGACVRRSQQVYVLHCN